MRPEDKIYSYIWLTHHVGVSLFTMEIQNQTRA